MRRVHTERLITDGSLEFLARRLRVLGYDVEVVRGARLDELFDAAARDGRAVLTLSVRRPRRHAAVAALRVPRNDPAGAVRAVAGAFAPAGPPFSRCPLCNSALQRRLSFEASGEVPGRVLRGAKHLSHCPTCGKWYWDGSHTARLRAWLEAALGRPLGPQSPAGT